MIYTYYCTALLMSIFTSNQHLRLSSNIFFLMTWESDLCASSTAFNDSTYQQYSYESFTINIFWCSHIMSISMLTKMINTLNSMLRYKLYLWRQYHCCRIHVDTHYITSLMPLIHFINWDESRLDDLGRSPQRNFLL